MKSQVQNLALTVLYLPQSVHLVNTGLLEAAINDQEGVNKKHTLSSTVRYILKREGKFRGFVSGAIENP